MNKELSLTPIFLATLFSFALIYLFEQQAFPALIGALLLATNFCFWLRVISASLRNEGFKEIFSFIIGKSLIVIVVTALLLFSKGDFIWSVLRGFSIALVLQVFFVAYYFRPSKVELLR